MVINTVESRFANIIFTCLSSSEFRAENSQHSQISPADAGTSIKDAGTSIKKDKSKQDSYYSRLPPVFQSSPINLMK